MPSGGCGRLPRPQRTGPPVGRDTANGHRTEERNRHVLRPRIWSRQRTTESRRRSPTGTAPPPASTDRRGSTLAGPRGALRRHVKAGCRWRTRGRRWRGSYRSMRIASPQQESPGEITCPMPKSESRDSGGAAGRPSDFGWEIRMFPGWIWLLAGANGAAAFIRPPSPTNRRRGGNAGKRRGRTPRARHVGVRIFCILHLARVWRASSCRIRLGSSGVSPDRSRFRSNAKCKDLTLSGPRRRRGRRPTVADPDTSRARPWQGWVLQPGRTAQVRPPSVGPPQRNALRPVVGQRTVMDACQAIERDLQPGRRRRHHQFADQGHFGLGPVKVARSIEGPQRHRHAGGGVKGGFAPEDTAGEPEASRPAGHSRTARPRRPRLWLR